MKKHLSIFLILFSAHLFSAEVPIISDLRYPGTTEDYTLTGVSTVPPSIAHLLPMTSTDPCILYDMYVQALKDGDAVKILQNRDGFAYTHDETDYSRHTCPHENDAGWSGSIIIQARGCLHPDPDAPEGCGTWRYSFFYGGEGYSKYRVTANRICPAAAPLEGYTLPVDTPSGLRCARPRQCHYPFKPVIEYDVNGYISKSDCLTYCRTDQKFDEFLGACIPKKEDVVAQSCPSTALNPINIKSGEKFQSFPSGLNLSGSFPLNLGINYGSQRDPRIRNQVLQNLRESQSKEVQLQSWNEYTQPSNYTRPGFNHWLKLDHLDPIKPEGEKLWYTKYDLKLITPTSGYYKNYIFIIENNHEYRKFKPGSTYYYEVAPNGDSLRKIENGWELTRNNLLYTFNSSGFLVKVTHPLGEYHLITRGGGGKITKIEHSNKQTATFNYTGSLLTSINVDGQVITFEYDDKNNLTKYSTGNSNSRSFSYDNTGFEHALTTLYDASNEQISSWSYDDVGRAISAINVNGLVGSIEYGLDKVIVNEEGKSAKEFILNSDGTIIKSGKSCDSGTSSSNDVAIYDDKGRIISKTDAEGNKTQYKYDGWGLLGSVTKMAGTSLEQTTSYTYNSPYNRLIETTYPNGLKVKNAYYTSGHLSGLFGYQKITYGSKSRKFTLAYNDQALVSSIDGFRTDVIDKETLEYNTEKQLTKRTNALGHVTQYDNYSSQGKLTQYTGPNGVSSSYQYDDNGNVEEIKQGTRTTTLTYDKQSQLKTASTNGNSISYGYNPKGQLNSITDSQGNQLKLTLDERGNPTKTEIIGTTNTIYYLQNHVYDSLNRLTSQTTAEGNTWQYKYDTKGNLLEQIDPNENSLTNQFDALSRVTSNKDELNAATLFEYNKNNQPTKVTDALGRSTTYEYSVFGEVIKRISPDTGTTTYGYDNAGNVTWQQDARGIKTTYTYDALNRVTQIGYPNSTENVLLEYDDATRGRFAIGRLSKVTDSSGSREYYYNGFGEVVKQEYTPVGTTTKITTAYTYNNAGNLTSITYPSGRLVSYSYNTAGKVNSVSTTKGSVTQTLASNISYLPFGPLTGLDYGNALQLTMTFNTSYQLTQKSVTGIYDSNYSYDAIDNITTIDELLAPSDSQTYVYDAVSRLTSATGSYDNLAFSYDGIGNRTNKTVSNVDIPYLYENGVLKSVDGITRTYDKAGNTLTDGKAVYSYNQAGRLTQAVIGNESYHYTYNHLGQRVKKQSSVQTRHYHYELSGLLLSESDELGNTLVEYVYLNGQRLAFITDQVYYVHTNHLDAPLALTNQQGETVWQAKYSPFGSIEVTLNNIANDFTARFPGQYSNNETGLYYNYFRDYDPELGRYIQSDPIGLAGGINTYGYVGGNPVNYVDPLGLARWRGRIEMISGGILVGGTKARAFLESDCDAHGKQWSVKLSLTSKGATAGIPWSITVSKLELNDPYELAKPINLVGDFIYSGFSFSTLLGYGISTIKIGEAYSASSGIVTGVDASWVDFPFGSSVVRDAILKNCGCDK